MFFFRCGLEKEKKFIVVEKHKLDLCLLSKCGEGVLLIV